jgi:hypothetical protein
MSNEMQVCWSVGMGPQQKKEKSGKENEHLTGSLDMSSY